PVRPHPPPLPHGPPGIPRRHRPAWVLDLAAWQDAPGGAAFEVTAAGRPVLSGGRARFGRSH
ncbi:hypothetical protein ACFW9F_03120, partial [Streptomyces sp. NPDC059506]|uniref:hypothetical protein n=1 Tax=Streptomyces sp. NPDC059506 TaxID=3347751 RepID=UPI00369E4BCA